MTFRQMVFKNFLANIRKYVVYYLCIFFSMTVFFLFTAIWYTPNFTEQTTSGMRQIIIIGWIITIIFSFLLIGYSHNQFFKLRLREFGILLSYGLLYRDVKNMIILENIILYLSSLVSAFVGGGIISRLFFLMTTSILGIEHIEFSLTINSFILTAICFIPVFGMVLLMTLGKTQNMSVVSLVKENRISEMNISGRWPIGISGLIMILCSLIALNNYTSDPSNVVNMKKATAGALVFCLIGLYLFINNFGVILHSYWKGRERRYYKSLLVLSEFSHKYRQNRTLIFMCSMLSLGIVMFTSLSYTLYSQSYLKVDKEQMYDVMFKESASMDYLNGIDYNAILSESKAKLTQKDTLKVVYLEASNIDTATHRPNLWVPISSVKEYNDIFSSNYSIKTGNAIIVSYDGDIGHEIFRDSIQLNDNQNSYSFQKIKTEYNKIFYRYAFGQPVLILVNDEDYSKLYRNVEEINKGKVHLYKYDDWTKSGEAVEKLNEEFTQSYDYWNNIHPNEVQSINQKFYGFQVISKYQQYEHNKQVGGFALFIMSFISLLFIVAICVLVYFKVMSDQEADKKKIVILSTVGITTKQIRDYLYGKLKMILVAPILLGSFIAIGFCISLNIGNILEWELPVSTVLYNTLSVALLYWVFILLYYMGLKIRYYKALL